MRYISLFHENVSLFHEATSLFREMYMYIYIVSSPKYLVSGKGRGYAICKISYFREKMRFFTK